MPGWGPVGRPTPRVPGRFPAQPAPPGRFDLVIKVVESNVATDVVSRIRQVPAVIADTLGAASDALTRLLGLQRSAIDAGGATYDGSRYDQSVYEQASESVTRLVVLIRNPADVLTAATEAVFRVRLVLVSLLELLPLAITYRQTLITDGGVARWQLNGIGPAMADDIGAFAGTAFGSYVAGQPGLVAQEPGTALQLDGTSAYVEVGWAAAINPAVFSVECWVRLLGGAGTVRAVVVSRDLVGGAKYDIATYDFSAYGSGTLTDGFQLIADATDHWAFLVGQGIGSNWTTITTGVPVKYFVTTHLVATFDGANIRLYVNGVLAAGPLLAIGYVVNGAEPLRLGAGSSEAAANQFLPAVLNDVTISNVALSADRVLQHYLRGAFESAARQLGAVRTASDVLAAVTELAIAGRVFYANAFEALVTSEAVAKLLGFQRAITDTVATVEGALRQINVGRGTVDTLAAAADAIAPRLYGAVRPIAETMATTDLVARLGSVVRATTETIAASDVVARIRSALRATADTNVATDAVTRIYGALRTVAVSFGTSDLVSRIYGPVRIAAETAVITDVVIRTQVVLKQIVDTSVATEAVARLQVLARATTDTLTAAVDVVSRIRIVPRAITESSAVTEAVVRLQVLQRVPAEALTLVDAIARAIGTSRLIAEAAGTVDMVIRIYGAIVARAETMVASESVARLRLATRTIVETITTTDVVNRLLNAFRIQSEGNLTTDVVRRLLSLRRAAVEALVTSEVVSRLRAVLRTVTDSGGSRYDINQYDQSVYDTATDKVKRAKTGLERGGAVASDQLQVGASASDTANLTVAVSDLSMAGAVAKED